jgi:hypothetical protein
MLSSMATAAIIRITTSVVMAFSFEAIAYFTNQNFEGQGSLGSSSEDP